jgi:hypothetical protein
MYSFRAENGVNNGQRNAGWVFGGIPGGRNLFFRREKNA